MCMDVGKILLECAKCHSEGKTQVYCRCVTEDADCGNPHCTGSVTVACADCNGRGWEEQTCMVCDEKRRQALEMMEEG